MLNRGALATLIALAFLVILSSWYAIKLGIIIPILSSSLPQLAELTGISLSQTNAQGKISYQGTASQAMQTGNDMIYFSNLAAEAYDQKNSLWNLSADQGHVTPDHQQIFLAGHVLLTHPGSSNSQPTVAFSTSSAIIFPNTGIITGNDWLSITETGSINSTKGLGFIADSNNKTLKLLSQVEGTYVKPNN